MKLEVATRVAHVTKGGSSLGTPQPWHSEDAGAAKITLLLVDDQPQIVRGLEMRLSLEPDVRVAGKAHDARTALDLVEQLHPNVITMDVELPGMDGIAATAELVRRWPRSAVIMLSLHDDANTQQRARQAGASAFVAKHRMEGPLLAAIREAFRRTCEEPADAP